MFSLFYRNQQPEKIAIIDQNGEYSYQKLHNSSNNLARQLDAKRIAVFVPPSFEFVVCQWAIWKVEAIFIPIALSYPAAEVEYVLSDSKAQIVLTTPDFFDFLEPIAQKTNTTILVIENISSENTDFYAPFLARHPALIIYTSGTTGKPKGVVSNFWNLEHQLQTLHQAWAWSADDIILNVLPLHHIHGLINVLTCALWAGATCQFQKFEPEKVWQTFPKITVFMAVPTIYKRLIDFWEQQTEEEQEKLKHNFSKMRLMVSGSAALPVSVLEKWEKISGHFLLERYGMTEIGMALSNPLNGVRKAGFVGLPLPNVEIRLVDENYNEAPEEGEIYVKSPSVFLYYWEKTQDTIDAFTMTDWFRTGDIAQKDADGYYKILGRKSADIIKTGAYKVSALEIENTLLNHSDISECAVVGIKDEDLGEKIAVAVVFKNQEIDFELLRKWTKQFLAPYKVPLLWQNVPTLPRNAMGKVLKNDVKKYWE